MAQKNEKVKVAEYGSWSSPITAETVVKGGGLKSSPVSEIHTCSREQQGKQDTTDTNLEFPQNLTTCSWNSLVFLRCMDQTTCEKPMEKQRVCSRRARVCL